ncbi:DUF4143 domain-containing protein [Membranihabitans maritimus]|uniref:DUF4143 domain-containing protein n=1 Tax=Membranihabitans maritimus TaxID=2904244 RepID=UPI001F403202|nr:DUF4143 domain-containing protein [Membranihabitans maritimus]
MEKLFAYERIKKQNYERLWTNNFFWRTYDHQELDWLDEKSGKLQAFEFKWGSRKKMKIPTAFVKAYPDASFQVISKNNYLDFIT